MNIKASMLLQEGHAHMYLISEEDLYRGARKRIVDAKIAAIVRHVERPTLYEILASAFFARD